MFFPLFLFELMFFLFWRTRRETDRLLRDEQDAAYRQSLLEDQEKERRLREEQERTEREERERVEREEREEKERLEREQAKSRYLFLSLSLFYYDFCFYHDCRCYFFFLFSHFILQGPWYQKKKFTTRKHRKRFRYVDG